MRQRWKPQQLQFISNPGGLVVSGSVTEAIGWTRRGTRSPGWHRPHVGTCRAPPGCPFCLKPPRWAETTAPEPSLGVLQAEATALSKAVSKIRGGSPHPQRAPSLVRAECCASQGTQTSSLVPWNREFYQNSLNGHSSA